MFCEKKLLDLVFCVTVGPFFKEIFDEVKLYNTLALPWPPSVAVEMHPAGVSSGFRTHDDKKQTTLLIVSSSWSANSEMQQTTVSSPSF